MSESSHTTPSAKLGVARAPLKRAPQARGYMALREARIRAQAPAARTELFAGCVFFFNSVKSTSQMELERAAWENGGAVLRGWARRRVTHVVADCLAGSKVQKELAGAGAARANRGSAVVVKPAWISACVAAGARVDVFPFRVVRDPTVRQVFFPGTKEKTPGDAG